MREKREGKEKVEEKVKVILLIVISKIYGKTGKLNGTIPYNIAYIGLYTGILMTNYGG